MTPPEVRFWRKVVITPGCWLWTASLKPNGYGQFGVSAEDRSHYAHRYAYETEVGPIPAGLTVDHLCRVRACVNPAHMELVTAEENYRRAVAARTHCRNGLHQLAAGLYRIEEGKRVCIPCQRESARLGNLRRTARAVEARGGVDRRLILSDEQVRELRTRRIAGERVVDLAREYGVAAKHADAIVNGRKRLERAGRRMNDDDIFLVARASCGCVESVLLPTDNEADRATFLLHFPHATPQDVWPIVRCDEHPPPHPNPLLGGAA